MALFFLSIMLLAFSSLPQMITGVKHTDIDQSGPTRALTCLRHMASSSVYGPKPVPGKHRSTTNSTVREGDSINFEKLRSEFVKVLCSRRSTEVPLSVKPAKPSTNPVCQVAAPPQFREAMASSPKAKIENLEELLVEENLILTTEAGEQGRLPVLILRRKDKHKHKTRPAVVFLHGTGQCKESLRLLLEAHASRGYVNSCH